MKALVLALALLVAAGGAAHAYPQFQLSHDQTCTGCHVSPAGGFLLSENGLNTAESMSRFGTAPEFFYGNVPTPDWLQLGGDFRAASGFLATPEKSLDTFPMQFDVYGRANLPNGFSVTATVGVREPQEGNVAATLVASREHYVMWQQNPGGTDGLYARVGRFMPVFGLRLAEHPDYVRRYGGTPLWSETYGAALEYVSHDWEAHVTGFVKDPLTDTAEHSNGVAAIAEYRLTEHFSLGAELMAQISDDDKRLRGGGLAKVYVPDADVLVQAEVQFVNQQIDGGGAPNQIVGYVLASRPITHDILLDVGLGHYDENLRIKDLDRDGVDVNVHWFATSHLELILTNRYEMIGFGNGGPSGGYSLLQVHYRL